MSAAPPIIEIHTPTASFVIVHAVNEETLEQLFGKLSRKSHTDFHGQRVGPGWIKYHFNDTFWNLDDDSDYTIFVWRQKSAIETSPSLPSSPTPSSPQQQSKTPTLHVHNPTAPLPSPDAYHNPAFYMYQQHHHHHHIGSAGSIKSKNSKTKSVGGKSKKAAAGTAAKTLATPKHKTDFEKFHSENGVRTVMGSIGPVQNVRMLLKAGYRHVYISRKFAMKHGFIPADAAPGHYGYGGLINIGTWPITLQPLGSASLEVVNDPNHKNHDSAYLGKDNGGHRSDSPQPKSTPIAVYLSEEPHFDVVLGRSFFERRQIKTNPTDPTEVVCLDTGERVEVEVVVLKDGRGEIVIVT